MESNQIQIIEVNRNTRREEERSMLRDIFIEATQKGSRNILLAEIENSFIRLDSRSRNTHGLDIDPQSAYGIGYSAIDTLVNAQTVADNFGIHYLTLQRLKNDYMASLAFISTDVIGYETPLTLTPKQYERMLRIKDLYCESQDYDKRLSNPEIKDLLSDIPHVELVLKEYSNKLSLKFLYQELGIEHSESKIGDLNKEIRSFLQGEADNPRGIRKTASDILFHSWIKNKPLKFMHDDSKAFDLVLKQIRKNSSSVTVYNNYLSALNLHKSHLRSSLRIALTFYLQGAKKNEFVEVLGIKNKFSSQYNSNVIAAAMNMTEKLLCHRIETVEDLYRARDIDIESVVRSVLAKLKSNQIT